MPDTDTVETVNVTVAGVTSSDGTQLEQLLGGEWQDGRWQYTDTPYGAATWDTELAARLAAAAPAQHDSPIAAHLWSLQALGRPIIYEQVTVDRATGQVCHVVRHIHLPDGRSAVVADDASIEYETIATLLLTRGEPATLEELKTRAQVALRQAVYNAAQVPEPVELLHQPVEVTITRVQTATVVLADADYDRGHQLDPDQLSFTDVAYHVSHDALAPLQVTIPTANTTDADDEPDRSATDGDGDPSQVATGDLEHGADTDGARVVPEQLRDAVARRLEGDAELAHGQSGRADLRRAVARALAAEGVVEAPDVWARLVRDLTDTALQTVPDLPDDDDTTEPDAGEHADAGSATPTDPPEGSADATDTDAARDE